MATNQLPQRLHLPLHRTTLIRDIYRVLLNTGRSYAAFTSLERDLIASFNPENEILDPMSGYGGLIRLCSPAGINSYSVEINAPQYYWQRLCHPESAPVVLQAISLLLQDRYLWPSDNKILALVDSEWFPTTSLEIIYSLIDLISLQLDKIDSNLIDSLHLIIAILLPFSGRLSCCTPTDMSTHVKEGGICVYKDWHDDFSLYLNALQKRLLESVANTSTHELYLADARDFTFPRNRFPTLLTSPPYPNFRDFSAMFKPENHLLNVLQQHFHRELALNTPHIIGSRFVSGREARIPTIRSANTFLDKMNQLRRTKQAIYDDAKYYTPYFQNYFCDLEEAYTNISTALTTHCNGFITVVNNTHRNIVIPVAEAVIEIWQKLGFSAIIHYSNESFHVGTKNPRARGLRARHTTYVIHVSR